MKAEMVNGSVIGNYRVQQKLGETADFLLYSGRTLDSEQEVLLKAMRQPPALIRLALPDFQGRTTRFLQLRHPSLVTVREIIRDENAFYIITDLHRGQLLSELLAQKKQLPYQAATALIEQLLVLLVYLHQQKITCLDLRPTNLYLSEDNKLQLGDAGLIQLLSLENQTTAPETVSALEYTAPERILYSKILGTKVDARSDLYAVGVLFYEMVTGCPPIHADSRENMIRAQIETVPLPLQAMVTGIPAPLEQVIFRALEKSPERRFAAAETMQTALRRAQAPDAGLVPLEPSLAFLMESLQMADGPGAGNVPKDGGGELKPVRTTGLLAGKTQRTTGKLPPLKNISSESHIAEAAAPTVPSQNEVPTLKPRGASEPLEMPSSAANFADPVAADLFAVEPVLELSELFAAEETQIEMLTAASLSENFAEVEIENDSSTEPLVFENPALDQSLPSTEPLEGAGLQMAEEEDRPLTLNEMFATPVDPTATEELEILPESIVLVDPDDDTAFDELRSSVIPSRWKRKALVAVASFCLLAVIGGSVLWLSRPAHKPVASSSIQTNGSFDATLQFSPTATIEPIASPTVAPIVAPTAIPTPSATATPTPTQRPTATPKPAATPTPQPTQVFLQPAPTPATTARVTVKPVKARPGKPAKPSLTEEMERRKRAILNSFTQ